MAKQFEISIESPCHENWDGMSPVDKGRFCDSCQKQVVDFTNMSDRQLAEFFKKPSNGSICGRFMSDQLDRSIDIPKKRIPWVKYFFTISIPAFLLSLKASANQTQRKLSIAARDTLKPKPLSTCNSTFMGDTIINPVEKTPKENVILLGKPFFPRPDSITGLVIDDKGEPVPFASVMIPNMKTGVACNEKGEFHFRPMTRWDSLNIQISAVGYATSALLVRKGETSKNMKIQLSALTISADMGIVIVTRKPAKKPAPLIPDQLTQSKKSEFRVFPNPVKTEANLTIECKKMKKGYHTIQLLSQQSQPVYTEKVWIDAEAKLLDIKIPAVTAGIYFVVLINTETGKRSTEKIIVQ